MSSDNPGSKTMHESRPTPDLPALLKGVSRSFYISIRLLPSPLRRPISVAYLLARAADTLADTADVPTDERASMLGAWASAIESGQQTSAVAEIQGSFAPLQRDMKE